MRTERPDRQPGDSDEALHAVLHAALRAEPLPPPLVERIRAELDRRCLPSRPRKVNRFHLLGLAAAACLMVAVMLPSQRADVADGRNVGLKLTSEEAAEIVAAYGAIAWDSPIDYTLSTVDTRLENLERTLRGEEDASWQFPWGRDDDWDVPPASDDGPAESRTMVGRLCRATFAPRSRG